MKLLKILSLGLLVILPTSRAVIVRGDDTAPSGAVIGETFLNESGAVLAPKAQFATGMFELSASNYVYFIVLRETNTGYTWWLAEFHPNRNDSFLGFTSLSGCRDTLQFGRGFWVVPGGGLVSILDQQSLRIADSKTASLEDAQTQLIAGFRMGEHNGVWPLEQHQKEIRLSLVQALGEDFFFMPGSAAMPPEPNVLALGFTNGTWSIKLASPVAKTNAVAVVVLASDFKIIKASRSDK